MQNTYMRGERMIGAVSKIAAGAMIVMAAGCGGENDESRTSSSSEESCNINGPAIIIGPYECDASNNAGGALIPGGQIVEECNITIVDETEAYSVNGRSGYIEFDAGDNIDITNISEIGERAILYKTQEEEYYISIDKTQMSGNCDRFKAN